MAFLTYNHNVRKITLIFMLVILLSSTTISVPATEPDLIHEDNTIHITSDLLISDNKSQTVELKGNVKATQKNTVITADNMIIYFKDNPLEKGNTTPNEQSISKIIASGDVHINFEDKVAQAEQAVYTAEERTLILTGKNVMLTSQANTITGEKITLNRNNDKIIVERGSGKQVEMIVTSDGNGIK